MIQNGLALDFLNNLAIVIILNVQLFYYLGIYITEKYYYNFGILGFFLFVFSYLY